MLPLFPPRDDHLNAISITMMVVVTATTTMMVVVTATTSDLLHPTRDHRHRCRHITTAISLLSTRPLRQSEKRYNRKILIIRIVVTFEIIKMHTTIKLTLSILPLGGKR
jgi:hypothetical protein